MRRFAPILSIVFGAIAVQAADARFLTGVAGTQAAGVVVGEGLILFSSSTHQDWTPATGVDSNLLYTAVVASNDGSFVAVAEDGSAWRSSNAQASGFVRRSSAAGVPLRAIEQMGAQLVAVGDAGTIVRSSDITGGSWVPVPSPTSRDIFAVATNGISSSVAVGEAGLILRGNLQGSEWQFIQISETENLRAVVSNPNGRFLAAGDRGALWSSDPNGTTWTRIESSITANIAGATQIGPATILVGNNETAYYAAQNFTDWQLGATPNDREYDLFAVAYTGSDVIAAGNRRTVLWSFIGLTWESSQVTPTLDTTWGRVKVLFQPEKPE